MKAKRNRQWEHPDFGGKEYSPPVNKTQQLKIQTTL
uniref:Uncharacterized protein n=1 Tax=Cucumis melo TaxID=3656 RepID=A0A9I9ECS5_CUCME